MATYATPGVYIEEITGPGVIQGVGTNTAAFIGPAASGPLRRPTVITTFDDFRRSFGRPSDGWPYLVSLGKRFYLGHGVQGFFENGGTRAYVVRVGTAQSASWILADTDGPGSPVARLEAVAEGAAGNALDLVVTDSWSAGAPALAFAQANVAAVPGQQVQASLAYAAATVPRFIAGDTVEVWPAANPIATTRNRITAVTDSGTGPVATLETALPAGADRMRSAYLDAQQTRLRLAQPSTSVQAGSLVRIQTGATTYVYGVVERTDGKGFVYLRQPLEQADGSPLAGSVDISGGPGLSAYAFAIAVQQGTTVLEQQTGLSLDPFNPGYLFAKTFTNVRVLQPPTPPPTTVLSQWQVQTGTLTRQPGVDDNPTGLSDADYQGALDTLLDVDDVNIVSVPDAAGNATLQDAIIQHCLAKRDRVAVLETGPGLSPANDPGALAYRRQVEADSGFAALYYPWLLVPEPVEPGYPRPLLPRPLAIPPGGHLAGVWAHVDETLGVHHAPANVQVLGVMGLERILSDREQGLINLEGVNALRIFPGEGKVTVWGARTTAPKVQTDWIFVSVRRLLLYIEESIQQGIRWAVFEPNAPPLWQSLKRTISEFLDRVWRAGGLAGEKREEAYQVRIDEGLNPPDLVALGQLHIEIAVAAVRPAEFIIVRIGLWDGGARVTEA